MFFELVFSTVVGIITATGYIGVFLLMAAESMILPVPSEAVMPFAGASGMSFALVVIAATLGSIAGSLLSYYIGLKGKSFLLKNGKYFLLHKKDLEKTEIFFKRHGEKTIFISRFIPVVRHFISIPAGIAKMDKKKFVLYTALGAAAWNFFLAYSGLILKENWTIITRYSQYIDIAVIVGLIIAVLWLLKRRFRAE